VPQHTRPAAGDGGISRGCSLCFSQELRTQVLQGQHVSKHTRMLSQENSKSLHSSSSCSPNTCMGICMTMHLH
jgi:hypothetical protein